MATKKEEQDALKSLPKTQIGVREMSNVRMVLMAAPICPIIDDEEDPRYTGEANCQTETVSSPGWWNICIERGHDPYFSVSEVIKIIPVTEERDGKLFVVGEEKQVIRKKRLNTVRVAVYTRINSGRGLQKARQLKGRKFLEEMGYAPVCEFRNCELPVKVKSRYGNFCSDRHARLIGADVEGIMLHAGKKKERNKQLMTIDISDDGGPVRLQEPPDIEGQQF